MKAFGNLKLNLYQLVLIDISEHEVCLLHKLSKHGCVLKNIDISFDTSLSHPHFFHETGTASGRKNGNLHV